MTLKKLNESSYTIPTQLIYGESLSPAWEYTHHVVPPITASSTYRLDSTQRGALGFGQIGTSPSGPAESPIYVYERMGDPNNEMLQHALAVAEQGECAVTFTTGMAAVHAALQCALKRDAEIIAHRTLYGCTYSLMTQWLNSHGITTHFCDLRDPTSIQPFVTDRTRIVYLESPVNPTLELIDLQAIAAEVNRLNQNRSAEQRIITIIDNTFATPWCQRPLTLGIDIVVHSLTKAISGFGTEMGGAVVTSKEFLKDLVIIRKDYGGSLAAVVAWNILTHGVPTLGLRMVRQQENALRVADFLQQHPRVLEVRYPGLSTFPQHELARRQMLDYQGNFAPGSMLYFVLAGATPEESFQRGERMMDFIAENGYAVTLAVSLGHIRTLIEHPGSMTHSTYSPQEQLARGLEPGGIRLSIGIEHHDDILRDLNAAIDACG